MTDKARWRRSVDALDGVIGPPLERLTRTEYFAEGVGLITRLRTEVTRRSERTTRRALHLWNLPAASDILRVLDRIAALERQVRDLSNQLADREVHDDAPTPRAERSRRSDQA